MVKIFDLFVIGAGSGGVRAARVAGSRGLKVGIAESWSLGGTCVNRGCVPKKLYSYASHFSNEFEIMKSFGWDPKKPSFNWKKLVSNKKQELRRLNKIYLNLLLNSKVKIFEREASFIDNETLNVGGEIIKAKKILIAVGSKPRIMNFSAGKNIINSDEAFDIKKLPKNVLILGGGYISVEFASIFNGLGVDTTVCIRGEKILKGFDLEVATEIMKQMGDKGVKFLTQKFPKEISYQEGKFDVYYNTKKKEKYDLVMEAVGRVPNIENLNLDNTDIKVNKNGSIIVDKYFKTSAKNVFAIGDVIDRIQLTPVAIAEAMVFVNNLKSSKKKSFEYKNIPTAVFCNPNYSYVGLSEEEAKKKFKKIDIYRSSFRPLKYSLSKTKEKVFIKLVVNKETDKVLGLHYVGDGSAEIVQGFSVAIVNGLKKNQFDKTIGIHPTSAEEIVTLK